MTLKTLLIDDEPKAISVLTHLLERYCPETEVVGSAHNAIEGVKLTLAKAPDLIFLDVEMPHGTGFDLLEALPHRNFQVIFVTAYDQYAIRAIKFNALDYLMKPVDPDDLTKAVTRAVKRKEKDVSLSFEPLLQHVSNGTPSKLAVPNGLGLSYIDIANIVRIEAQGNYTQLIQEGEKPLLVSRKLKAYEESLPPNEFVRVHNSHVVNLRFVQSFIRKDGGMVRMLDGSSVEVSRKYRPAFLEALQHFSRTL